MITLIVTDLDDTLLNSDKKISKYTEKVFAELNKKGIKTIINTARNYKSSEQLFKTIRGYGLICFNGAVIYENSRIIWCRSISYSDACNVLVSLDRFMPEKRWAISYFEKTYVNYSNSQYRRVYANTELPNDNPLKITVRNVNVTEYKNIKEIFQEKLHTNLLKNGNMLITHLEAQKKNALSFVLNKNHISPKNVVAFGNDINDIGFMVQAHYSIAVNNADEEVKSKARYICLSNDSDGVAKWLENNLL